VGGPFAAFSFVHFCRSGHCCSSELALRRAVRGSAGKTRSDLPDRDLWDGCGHVLGFIDPRRGLTCAYLNAILNAAASFASRMRLALGNLRRCGRNLTPGWKPVKGEEIMTSRLKLLACSAVLLAAVAAERPASAAATCESLGTSELPDVTSITATSFPGGHSSRLTRRVLCQPRRAYAPLRRSTDCLPSVLPNLAGKDHDHRFGGRDHWDGDDDR
jgi:hypothetical protein